MHLVTLSSCQLVTPRAACYTYVMPSELLADVAVRATIPGTDAVFTYRIPKRLHALTRPGQLVWAPLRRQRVQGIILDLYRQNEAGEWMLEGDQPVAARPSIDRLRPD